MDKSAVLVRVCSALLKDDRSAAARVLELEYPALAQARSGRSYSAEQTLRVFLRDGFIDRYSGARLVFPGTLRLLSHVLPDEFPAHPNWKLAHTHPAFWEQFPTIDHVVPVARGGQDHEANWVTTSMMRNTAKAHWTLEELGWQLVPAGSANEWDGLTSWFVDYTDAHPDVLTSAYLKRWRAAALRVRR